MSIEERKRKSTETLSEIEHLPANKDFRKKRKKENNFEDGEDDTESHDSDIIILPSSVISLSNNWKNTANQVQDTNDFGSIESKLEYQYNSLSAEHVTNENNTYHSTIDDDIICLDDDDDHLNISHGDDRGGGFIVNGQIQYDQEPINAGWDTQYVKDDIDDIDYAAPTSGDDGIEFVNIVQDHGLVPRVFSGHIKEFITERPNRLGMILSKECGT